MNQEEEVKIYRSYPAKWGILFTGINKQYLLQVSITKNTFTGIINKQLFYMTSLWAPT